ncbi:MAG: methyl-accepting chemotaxis protein [Deltaproteobacteria bacterium]|nr:methyl-accepting chemotaxis protein [Deltaproteobacteria bacterium]
MNFSQETNEEAILKEYETSRFNNLLESHTKVQKALIKIALPIMFLIFSITAVASPLWQNQAMVISFLFLTGFWFYSARLTRKKELDLSVLIFTNSLILYESISLFIIDGNSGPALLTCMITITYSSQFSKKIVFINALTIGISYIISIIIDISKIIPQRAPSLIGDGIFVIALLPVAVYILISMQNYREGLVYKSISLTYKQKEIIKSAKNITDTINGVSSRIQEVSNSLAAQLSEQAAAIAENSTIFKNISHIATTTANEALITSGETGQTAIKSKNEILRLQKVKEQFNIAIGASEDTKDEFIELAKNAENIDEVLRLNREVANQIKILAINAAIQAAKAGEAGKGFNVVATKMKSMILNTEKQLENSQLLLNDIKIKAQNGAQSISKNSEILQQNYEDLDDTASILKHLGNQFTTTSSQLERITASAKEQQYSIIQINTGLEQINTAAEDLGNHASTLVEAVTMLDNSKLELINILDIK